jgi:hypothetical protein
MTKKINIEIFYHLFIDDEWYSFSIFNEQMNTLLNSGLLHNCVSLNIGIIYCGVSEKILNKINKLIEQYNINSNIRILYISDSGNECNTGIFLKNYCDLLPSLISEHTYILYFHSKGVSHFNTEKELPTKYWRHYLEYFNLIKWKNCVDKLNDGYDSCGTLWFSQKNHPILLNSEWINSGFYAGSFFWVKSSLIQKIPLKNFTNEVFYRECMESIPSIIEHNFYSFDNTVIEGNHDLYFEIYNPKKYYTI